MPRSTTLFLLAAAALLAACQTPARQAAPAPSTPAPPAWAEGRNDPNLVAFGHRVAERHCAQCHALDPGQASPLADAPPFPMLYERFPVERLSQELQEGMMVGHPRMPLLPRLDEDEATALVAYLSHFRRNEAGEAPR